MWRCLTKVAYLVFKKSSSFRRTSPFVGSYSSVISSHLRRPTPNRCCDFRRDYMQLFKSR
uniref:Uncharacterized protein n=1 Tax=Cucumis melo TaxID=3656 RepID=A0A9I9EBB0_CUCME